MHFVDQSGVLMSIGLMLGWGESGHPHLLGILPGLIQWPLHVLYIYFSRSCIFLQFFVHPPLLYMTSPY